MAVEQTQDDEPKRYNKPPKKVVKSKKHHFETWEDQLIRDNWMTSTDVDIAKRLNRPVKGIERRRKILGLKKSNGRPQQETRREAIFTNPTEYTLSRLSKEDRINFYKTNFQGNARYNWLEKTLLDDELEYYKHKYIEIIEAMDTCSHQEEDLVHNMVMKEIQIMRIQTDIRDAVAAFREAEEGEKRPVPPYLYENLDKMEKQYLSYQEKLKLTREQRLKTDREEKITITALVRAFLDSDNRQKVGDMAGQMDYYVDKCRNDMSKMNFLLGG